MNRELDAKVAEKIFGYEVRMFGAGRDPECGNWEICIGCDPRMDPSPEERAMFHLDCDKPGHKAHPCILIQATAETSEWWEVCPDYSSDMNDVFKVVGKIICSAFSLDCYKQEWTAAFKQIRSLHPLEATVTAKTAPEAICLAALKSVGCKID